MADETTEKEDAAPPAGEKNAPQEGEKAAPEGKEAKSEEPSPRAVRFAHITLGVAVFLCVTQLLFAIILTTLALFGFFTFADVEGQRPAPGQSAAPADAVAQAQAPPQTAPAPNAHDRSDVFDPSKTPPSSPAFGDQPEKGMAQGFDFARDPFNAKKPNETFDSPTTV